MSEDQECQALLRRICETPADDAPRWILSDRLEELGEEERARFIRRQVAEFPKSRYQQIMDHPNLHQELGRFVLPSGTGASAIWERGFISEIRLTCAEFMGGWCETCDGDGFTSSISHRSECERCAGTGRIEGVARALFERHPITRVVLTEKNPSPIPGNGGGIIYGANWEPGIRYDAPHQVPFELAEAGKWGSYFYGGLMGHRFHSEAAALAALSDACVAYGRNLVGLPPLDSTSYDEMKADELDAKYDDR
jgi:uncharacterized protein (TIGR02996 family)